MIEFLRAILGGLFLFVIPGLAWCLLLFGNEKKDMLELAALSIALSISLSTLSIFFLNSLLDVKITLINTFTTLFILTIIPVLIWIMKSNNNKVLVINNKKRV